MTEFEERAAIIEYGCNVPREVAEEMAREQMQEKARKTGVWFSKDSE